MLLVAGCDVVRVHLSVPVAGRISHFFVYSFGDHVLFSHRDGLCHGFFDLFLYLVRNHYLDVDGLTFGHLDCACFCDFSWHLDFDCLIYLDLYISQDIDLLGHGDLYLQHYVDCGWHLDSDLLGPLLRRCDLYRYHRGHVVSSFNGHIVLLIDLNLCRDSDVLELRLAWLANAATAAGLDYADATGLTSGYHRYPLDLVDGFGHRPPSLLHGSLTLLGHLRLHDGRRDHLGPLNVLFHVYHDCLRARLLLIFPNDLILLHHLFLCHKFLDDSCLLFVDHLLLSNILIDHDLLPFFLGYRFHHNPLDHSFPLHLLDFGGLK